MYFKVQEEVLTDGSVAHNVIGQDGDDIIVIGAMDEDAANDLANHLNDDGVVAWVRVGG